LESRSWICPIIDVGVIATSDVVQIILIGFAA
jgi:hypothetical protein